jgi:hypothetical protein
MGLFSPASSSAGLADVDLQDFISRAGGQSSFTSTEISALSLLVRDLKSNGLWAKMIAFYPFAGRAATPAAQNLISSSYTLTWNGSWQYASWGVRGSGRGNWADTGFYPATGFLAVQAGSNGIPSSPNNSFRSGSFGCHLLQTYNTYQVSPTEFWNQRQASPPAGWSGADLGTNSPAGTSSINFPNWNRGGTGGQSAASVNAAGTWIASYKNAASSVANSLTSPLIDRILWQGTAGGITAVYSNLNENVGAAKTSYTYTGSLLIGGQFNANIDSSSSVGYFSSDRPFCSAFIGYGLTASDAAALNSILFSYQTNRAVNISTKLIVSEGDSIMSGFQSRFGNNAANGQIGAYGAAGEIMFNAPFSELTPQNFVTYAIGGKKTSGITYSGTGTGFASHFAGSGNRYLTWIGTNDLGAGGGASYTATSTVMNGLATSALTNLKNVWAKARADGYWTVALTVLKRSDFPQGSNSDNARIQINNSIKAAAGIYVDQVIDVDSVFSYGDVTASSSFTPTFFVFDTGATISGAPQVYNNGSLATGSYVHPNTAGQKAVWAYVASVLR